MSTSNHFRFYLCTRQLDCRFLTTTYFELVTRLDHLMLIHCRELPIFRVPEKVIIIILSLFTTDGDIWATKTKGKQELCSRCFSFSPQVVFCIFDNSAPLLRALPAAIQVHFNKRDGLIRNLEPLLKDDKDVLLIVWSIAVNRRHAGVAARSRPYLDSFLLPGIAIIKGPT